RLDSWPVYEPRVHPDKDDSAGDLVESQIVQRIGEIGGKSAVADAKKGGPEVFGKRGADVHGSAAHGMFEQQPRGVKKMPLRRKGYQPASTPAAVRVVADHRMSDGREVHPNLMR